MKREWMTMGAVALLVAAESTAAVNAEASEPTPEAPEPVGRIAFGRIMPGHEWTDQLMALFAIKRGAPTRFSSPTATRSVRRGRPRSLVSRLRSSRRTGRPRSPPSRPMGATCRC